MAEGKQRRDLTPEGVAKEYWLNFRKEIGAKINSVLEGESSNGAVNKDKKRLDLTTVKELLGHKTLTMTLRYAHLAPSHKVRAVEALDSSINKKSQEINESRKLFLQN